jgi:hypothetical protein
MNLSDSCQFTDKFPERLEERELVCKSSISILPENDHPSEIANHNGLSNEF